MKRISLLKILIPAAALFAYCTSLQTANGPGNGSETIAKIHGTAFLPGGKPADSAQVVLLRSSYNPLADKQPSGDSVTYCDSHGRYELPVALDSSAIYNLEISSAAVQLSLTHSQISGKDTNLSFLNDTLAPTGAVTITLPAGLTSGALFMPGSTRSVDISQKDVSRGYAIFDSIPAGTSAPVVFTPAADKNSTQILHDTVTVVSKSTTVCRNLIIYSDSQSIITDSTVWVNCCSFKQDSADPAFEGKWSYRFDYSIADYFAGAGMNLDNWGRSPMWDFSHCRSVRFAYRGLAAGHSMNILLRDADSTKASVTVGWGPADTFTVVEVPLTSFSNVNLQKIFEINFGVSGPYTGTGTVWIDDVEVMK
jgi:hypothetical protein